MEEEPERRAAAQLKTSLVEALEEFFSIYLGPEAQSPPDEVSDQRLRLATAVLLVEITRADFEICDAERRGIVAAIGETLALAPAEAERIAVCAISQAERTPRLHEYAAIVDQRCSPEQKKRIVEALWRVAFSDAELLPHEEYLVRKIAELLNLSTADLIEAKVRAREAFR